MQSGRSARGRQEPRERQTGRRTWRMYLWYFHSEGLCETVRSVMPSSAQQIASVRSV